MQPAALAALWSGVALARRGGVAVEAPAGRGDGLGGVVSAASIGARLAAVGDGEHERAEAEERPGPQEQPGEREAVDHEAGKCSRCAE